MLNFLCSNYWGSFCLLTDTELVIGHGPLKIGFGSGLVMFHGLSSVLSPCQWKWDASNTQHALAQQSSYGLQLVMMTYPLSKCPGSPRGCCLLTITKVMLIMKVNNQM